jgi:hypothetical protein
VKLPAPLRLAVRIAFSPAETTDELLTTEDHVRHAVGAWLWISVLYGLAAFIGGLHGLGPVVEPTIPLPRETYYLWLGPLTPLLYLVNFVLFAGLVQLLSRLVGGEGGFEATFSVVALAFVFPVFLTMWLFEAPVLILFPHCARSEMGGLAYLPVWADAARQVFGLAWVLLATILAVGRVQRIPVLRSIAVTLFSAIPAWMVTLTYLR